MAPGLKTAGAGGMMLGTSMAITYAMVAVASNFITKMAGMLMPGAPDAILTIQLLTMHLVMQAARIAGVVDMAPTSFARLKAMLPMSLTYGMHAALVLRALAALNVPMYNTLKRMTPIIVMAAKICIERKLPSFGVMGSVLLVVAGCIVAGAGDLAFDFNSYALALSAAALQATYILFAEYLDPSGSKGSSSSSSNSSNSNGHVSPGIAPRIDSNGKGPLAYLTPVSSLDGYASSPKSRSASAMSLADFLLQGGSASKRESKGRFARALFDEKADSIDGKVDERSCCRISPALRSALSAAAEGMHYSSLTCLPVFAVAAMTTGQFTQAQAALHAQAEQLGWPYLGLWLLAIACIEWLLTGTLILCTQTNSALTTTVVGVLKGILAVALGFVLLGGMGPRGASSMGITGIAMNCAGGVWYAVVKYREGKGGGA